jgi:hypothetical protein
MLHLLLSPLLLLLLLLLLPMASLLLLCMLLGWDFTTGTIDTITQLGFCVNRSASGLLT